MCVRVCVSKASLEVFSQGIERGIAEGFADSQSGENQILCKERKAFMTRNLSVHKEKHKSCSIDPDN